jgi:transposase
MGGRATALPLAGRRSDGELPMFETENRRRVAGLEADALDFVEFVRDVRGRTHGTVAAYRFVLQRFILWAEETGTAPDLDPASPAMAGFRAHLLAAGLAALTVKEYADRLQAFRRWRGRRGSAAAHALRRVARRGRPSAAASGPKVATSGLPRHPVWGLRLEDVRIADDLWLEVNALLPCRRCPLRPSDLSDLECMEAILFVLRTRRTWNCLAEGATARQRFLEWSECGLFQRLHQAGLLRRPPFGEGIDWTAVETTWPARGPRPRGGQARRVIEIGTPLSTPQPEPLGEGRCQR